MKQRQKKSRAIEPNQGIQRKFEKRLQALNADFKRMILRETFQALQDQGMLATDEKPSEKSMLASIASGKRFSEFHQRFIKNNLLRWNRYYASRAQSLVSWFVKSTAGATSEAQKKALEVAGVPRLRIVKRFGIPVINRQYISPNAAKKLGSYIEEVTNLVTKISNEEVERLQDVVASGLENGQSLNQIRRTLNTFSSFDDNRAKRVALDQSTKINQEVQRQNAKELGITQAVWKHVPGKYTSRVSHSAMDGKKFDIDKGMWDEEVGRYVKPGELPYCRCVMQLIFDDEDV